MDKLRAAKEAYLKDKSDKNLDKYIKLLHPLRGCTDKEAENYDENKKLDDGSCVSKAAMDKAMEAIGDKLTRSEVLNILKNKQHGAFWTPEMILRTVVESYEYEQIHKADERRESRRNPFLPKSAQHRDFYKMQRESDQEIKRQKEELKVFLEQQRKESLRRREQLLKEKKKKEREDQELDNLFDIFSGPPPQPPNYADFMVNLDLK